jgi:hypothetical protein
LSSSQAIASNPSALQELAGLLRTSFREAKEEITHHFEAVLAQLELAVSNLDRGAARLIASLSARRLWWVPGTLHLARTTVARDAAYAVRHSVLANLRRSFH